MPSGWKEPTMPGGVIGLPVEVLLDTAAELFAMEDVFRDVNDGQDGGLSGWPGELLSRLLVAVAPSPRF